MNRKPIISILTILLIISVHFSACDVFEEKPKEIKEGFSSKLLYCLETQYGITIPEEAKFIKGYNMPGFQDPSVIILFECPINHTDKSEDHMSGYMKQLLNLGDRYSSVGADSGAFLGTEVYEELGGKMEWMLDDLSLSYTFISYNIEPERLLIRFIGWRPSKTFP